MDLSDTSEVLKWLLRAGTTSAKPIFQGSQCQHE